MGSGQHNVRRDRWRTDYQLAHALLLVFPTLQCVPEFWTLLVRLIFIPAHALRFRQSVRITVNILLALDYRTLPMCRAVSALIFPSKKVSERQTRDDCEHHANQDGDPR